MCVRFCVPRTRRDQIVSKIDSNEISPLRNLVNWYDIRGLKCSEYYYSHAKQE